MSPSRTQALLQEGRQFHQRGALGEAAERYRSVLADEPASAEALELLTALLLAQGRAAEALGALDRAEAAAPDSAATHHLRGVALMGCGKPDEALAAFARAAALNPDFARAWFNHALTAIALRRFDVALASLERAVALKPDLAAAHLHRGKMLLRLGRTADAAEAAQRALALQPGSAAALELCGHAQRLLGDRDAALDLYDQAIAADPDHPGPLESKGKFLVELGRLDEARKTIGRAIALDPGNADLLQTMADLGTVAAGDPVLAAMETLAARIDELPAPAQTSLHFALGKALGDTGEHARSFGHLLKANALMRGTFRYDEAAVLRDLGRCRDIFSEAFFRERASWGEPSATPVFILGMPRSGTSLAEQILASHPAMHGAGEREDFQRLLTALGPRDGRYFPYAAPLFGKDDIARLGADYAATLTALAPRAARIVDKLPGNFVYAGLIHLALPHARIIHTRRNAIDTCLSCFSIRFGAAQPFAYDLAELGRYYRAYEMLMAHWRTVLPQETLLEVDYEDIVADVERQARRMVAHCGLGWDARCLAFYETERPVHTASAAQVRKPIYRGSIERWRPYREQLRPLFDALGLDPDRAA